MAANKTGRFVILVMASEAGLKLADALVFRASQAYTPDEVDLVYVNPSAAQSLLKNTAPDTILQKAYAVKPYVKGLSLGYFDPIARPLSSDEDLEDAVHLHFVGEPRPKYENNDYAGQLGGSSTGNDAMKIPAPEQGAVNTQGPLPVGEPLPCQPAGAAAPDQAPAPDQQPAPAQESEPAPAADSQANQ